MVLGLAKIEKIVNKELTIGLVSAPMLTSDRTAVTLQFGIGGVGNEVIVFSKTVVLVSPPRPIQEIVDEELATIKRQLFELSSS